MSRYDAVLFDNDGVLVTPPAFETQVDAVESAFRALGVDSVPRDHLTGLVEGVTVDRIHEIGGHHGLDPGTLWKTREAHDEQSQIEQFRAGARECYDDVSAIGDLSQVRGVVSNNHHSTVEFVLDHFDLHPHFETYYGREMTVESIRRKKPDPHYLDRAVEELGVESALYVGDSESDVLAAEAADLDSVFVRRSHSDGVELGVEPTFEVESLHDVVEIAGK